MLKENLTVWFLQEISCTTWTIHHLRIGLVASVLKNSLYVILSYYVFTLCFFLFEGVFCYFIPQFDSRILTINSQEGQLAGCFLMSIHEQKMAIFPTIMILNRGFLKRWYPTTIGFPTKNDQHLGVLNGGATILGNTQNDERS